MTVRVGVIGLGRAGLRHLDALARIEEVRVAALCDADRRLAENAAQRFDATPHINFRTMLEAERLDAVFVCLPPSGRGEPEVLAAKRGVHIFAEQPLALSIEKARAAMAEIERAGVVAATSSPGRYSAGLGEAIEALSGRRVTLVAGRSVGPEPEEDWRRRRDSSGGLFVLGCMGMFDLARYVVGEAAAVFAHAAEGLVPRSAREEDLEDAVSIAVRFAGGPVGAFTAAIGPVADMRLTVLAEEVEVVAAPGSVELVTSGRRSVILEEDALHLEEYRAFFEAVRTGDASGIRCDYADGARTLALALAAAESARSGRPVVM